MNSNKSFNLIVILCLLIVASIQGQEVQLEKAESFFPNWESLNKEAITWNYLQVPENWEEPKSKLIKIAVAVLKNTSNKENANAVVFIQGGPGGSGIDLIGNWRDHPLRKNNDIVLVDIRGTGFSEPRLCPDLGESFLKILAKNQTVTIDEEEKVAMALSCKQDLLNRGVDINAYNSLSIAKDLNALKIQLGYKKWHVYGVSYGTYMAQVYASVFLEDIESLILDSPIDDVATYYTNNTSNFVTSLSMVFEKCKNDPECNQQYPDLENIFYQVVDNLAQDPIKVSIDTKIGDSDEFVYNAEDFKVAIQQALYHKQLIEVIPLLIYQFHTENEAALGNLVAAFSSLLSMDYGVYYCVSCNEVLPNNEFSKFKANALKHQQLNGGISFYQSDFKVCEKWNEYKTDSLLLKHDLSNLNKLTAPVLVFSGEYDPITPSTNGRNVQQKFSNSHLVNAHTFGHAASFSPIGNEITAAFANDLSTKPNLKAFEKAKKITLTKDIKLNPGISKLGASLKEFHPLFILPLLIALLLMIVFVFINTFRLIKKRYTTGSDKIIRALGILTSIVGIIVLVGFITALINVANSNQFILAFGLPKEYDYLYIVLFTFVALMLISLGYFIIQIKKIKDRSVVFSVIFSNLVFVVYFWYWGIL
ncbi:MAG: alpha/beta fold hydrolase [Saprospiraceae bacterium]